MIYPETILYTGIRHKTPYRFSARLEKETIYLGIRTHSDLTCVCKKKLIKLPV